MTQGLKDKTGSFGGFGVHESAHRHTVFYRPTKNSVYFVPIQWTAYTSA